MLKTPYHRVQSGPDGRWLVVHDVPGLQGSVTVDADCLTFGAAERECAWLNAERDRQLREQLAERQLLGLRA